MMDNNEEQVMRLAKFLAAAGIASRRRCEELIREGRVTVNGATVLTPAVNIDAEADEISCEGSPVKIEKKLYFLLNKPAGYTCSASDPHAGKLVYELIPKKFGRLFTVGRLDRDSEGLLIVTNDGNLAQELTHPSRQVEKCYLVSCEGNYTTATRRQLLEGVYDGGEFLRPVRVEQRGHFKGHAELEITLTEGKKREVRRMCKAVGLEVTALQRMSFGSLHLGELPVGTWRQLTTEEVDELRKAAAKARRAPRQWERPAYRGNSEERTVGQTETRRERPGYRENLDKNTTARPNPHRDRVSSFSRKATDKPAQRSLRSTDKRKRYE